jgi:hypothetical protein
MSRVCTVCQHPAKAAIDQALINRTPLRDVAAQYQLTDSSVARHKASHLPRALTQAQEEHEAARADDLLGEARKVKDITMALLGRAVQAGDLRTALVAVREARGNLELIGKLLGELDDGPAVNIMVSAEWVAVRGTLLAALGAYPDARAAVAQQLLALEASNGHRG